MIHSLVASPKEKLLDFRAEKLVDKYALCAISESDGGVFVRGRAGAGRRLMAP